MNAKHTPGPWKAAHRQGADGNYRTEVFSDEYGGVATCDWAPKHCGNGVTATYREANARLIAAAPDLLEELNQMVRAYVRLLENGRDRIKMLGGDCDPLDKMEADDPNLRAALATIRAARGQCQETPRVLRTGSGPWNLDSKAAKFLADTITAGDEPTEITLRLGFIRDDDGTVQYGLLVEESEYPEEGAVLLVECNPLNAAPIEPVKQDTESFLNGPSCKQHPDAPHSFDINASNCAGRYVCECEGWIEPVKQEQELSHKLDTAIVEATNLEQRIDAALEMVKQEPVAKVVDCDLIGNPIFGHIKRPLEIGALLYAAPVRTKDLKDDEIDQVAGPFPKKYKDDFYYFARAVIAADREKNK